MQNFPPHPYIFFIVLGMLYSTLADFNPFSDDDLYAIHWAEPTDLEKIKVCECENQILNFFLSCRSTNNVPLKQIFFVILNKRHGHEDYKETPVVLFLMYNSAPDNVRICVNYAIF